MYHNTTPKSMLDVNAQIRSLCRIHLSFSDRNASSCLQWAIKRGGGWMGDRVGKVEEFHWLEGGS